MTLKSAGLADFTAQIISVVTSGNSLKQFYDRNALYIASTYYATDVAPHALTTRFTYTVPANRKFMVTLATAKIQRTAAAAPAHLADIFVTDGNLYISFALLPQDNAIGDKDSDSTPSQYIVPAGTVLAVKSQDASTGGTVTYIANLGGTEFDA